MLRLCVFFLSIVAIGFTSSAADFSPAHRDAARELTKASGFMYVLKCNLYTMKKNDEWHAFHRSSEGLISTSLHQDMFQGWVSKTEIPENHSPQFDYDKLKQVFENELVELYSEVELKNYLNSFALRKSGDANEIQMQSLDDINQYFTDFVKQAIVENTLDWRYTKFLPHHGERVALSEKIGEKFATLPEMKNMIRVVESDGIYYTVIYQMRFPIAKLPDHPDAIPKINYDNVKAALSLYLSEQPLEVVQAFYNMFFTTEIDQKVEEKFNIFLSDFLNYRVFNSLKAQNLHFLNWFESAK